MGLSLYWIFRNKCMHFFFLVKYYYVDEIMKTYIISLERSTDRREQCFASCLSVGLKPTWFKAVNGREVLAQPQNIHLPAGIKIDLQDKITLNLSLNRSVIIEDKLTASELGCALSHLSVYHHIVENNIEQALILEDDCLLKPPVADILPIILSKPNIWDMVLLYSESGVRDLWGRGKIYLDRDHHIYMKRKGMGPLLDSIFNRRRMSFLACAYLINLKAAKRLLKLGCHVCLPADYLTGLIAYHKLRLFTCHPRESLACVNSFASTISFSENRPKHRLL